jgi:type IV pilus assembly protein PilX
MNRLAYGARQRGVVLITSLLLLVVVTIIALSMFRSFGIQEKIAGNTREKQRALQAAVSAQQYAENWLSANAGSTVQGNCVGLINARFLQPQICTNVLSLSVPDVTNVPWTIAGAPVGVFYIPDGMNVNPITSVTAAANPTYYGAPTFYISYLGVSADGTGGTVYQVDAVGYGGAAGTAAVVESTYEVSTSSTCTSCNP